MRRRAGLIGLLVVAFVVAFVGAWAGAARPSAADEDDYTPEVFPPQARDNGVVINHPTVKLGEPLQIVITVRSRPDVVVELPATLETEPFEVTGRVETSERESPEIVKHEYSLIVVAWETGELQFPSVPISYIHAGEVKKLETQPLAVSVGESLPAGAAQPEDIAPPVRVRQRDPRVYWAIGIGAVAILLGVAGWFVVDAWRTRRRHVELAVAPVIDTRTPEEIALARLRALASSELIEGEDRRPFYFAVTEVLREYLGRRYGFDALELTSSELLAALERSAPADVRLAVASWLGGCDLVKYAKAPATRDDARHTVDEAVSLVERARPVPPPAPAQQEVAHVA